VKCSRWESDRDSSLASAEPLWGPLCTDFRVADLLHVIRQSASLLKQIQVSVEEYRIWLSRDLKAFSSQLCVGTARTS
jgi:hypothetical protein